jgi:hypothetical protein
LKPKRFKLRPASAIRSSALASGGKDLSGFALGESAWHHFASSQEKNVRLILSLSYTGSYPHLGDFLSLYLNDKAIDVSNVAAEKTSEFAYFEADCGLVSILEGDNVLEIRGLRQCAFALDNVDFSTVVLSSNFSTRSFRSGERDYFGRLPYRIQQKRFRWPGRRFQRHRNRNQFHLSIAKKP